LWWRWIGGGVIGLAVGLLDFENLENAFFFLPEKKLFKTKPN